MTRRDMLKALAVTGVSGRIASALAEEARVSPEMIRGAEWIAGLELTDADRELMLEDLGEALAEWAKLRGVALDNSVPPALRFHPVPASPPASAAAPARRSRAAGTSWRPLRGLEPPSGEADIAFATISELATWLRRRKISSSELTELYLRRLEAHDPVLRCVISRTEERAREAAAAADRRIASGDTRGPLDGIPWGAKDLLSVAGQRTTWGSKAYEDQVRDDTATVVRHLDEAGAPLLAKLSVGELAWGDVWFGGTTKSPWNTEQGSSGSSAGPGAATAAGLVGFAIGTETWGSIVSPCTRCGVSGLRPTFGRVSRHGCMALSWSMDKIGPMARSLEDCARIFDAVRGADGLDPAARDAAFSWPGKGGRRPRVGFVPSLFEEDRASEIEGDAQNAEAAAERRAAKEWEEIDRDTLRELEGLGYELIPIELPKDVPVTALSLILTAEAAAAFDELTRSGKDDLLVRQERHAWPNVFRQGQLIPAVEYIRANRIRTLLMRDMEKLFERVDAYVTPTFGGDNLLLTNLTGHPQIVLPNGFRSDGTPTSITITGSLDGEEDLLALGVAYQSVTDHHRRRPALFAK
ncbi:MAG: amidase family protein [Candidatus Eiseniibacteriota bacterium]